MDQHLPEHQQAVDTLLNRLACELNLEQIDRNEEGLRALLLDLAGRLAPQGDSPLLALAARLQEAAELAVLPDLAALVVDLDREWWSWKERQAAATTAEAVAEADLASASLEAPIPTAWTMEEELRTAVEPTNVDVAADPDEAAVVDAVVDPMNFEASPVQAETTQDAVAASYVIEVAPEARPVSVEALSDVPVADAPPDPVVISEEPPAVAVDTEASSALEAATQEAADARATALDLAAFDILADLEPASAGAEGAAEGDAIVEDTVDEDVAALLADRELADMFVAEALDHLRSIEATVLDLEASPTDSKLLNDVFRPFHTVKGNAGALGVRSVQEFAHKVENLLDLARSGQHDVGPAEIDVVLQSVDLLTAMLEDIVKRMGGDPGKDLLARRAQLTRTLKQLIEGTEPEAEALTVAASAEAAQEAVATEAPATADAIEALVVPAAVQPEPAAAAPSAPVPIAAPVVVPTPAPAVRASGAPAPAIVARVGKPESDVPAPAKSTAVAASRDTSAQSAVKVDTRKLDNLVDMVGELVIVQSLIQQDPVLLKAIDERLGRNLSQLRRITGDLQRSAMAMRMVPIRQTFQKMARLVRDISKSTGKSVELVLTGEDTELDRKMVEDIGDPLVHMVRNSLDHGLEDGDTRVRLGKRPVGRLALSAYHQGGSIVISISDDGSGLNTEKILAKAVQKGLIAPGASLSQSEIHQLIFQPGFSTADRVTEISGRGVGLDVVRRNIELLRGRIEIHSTPGQGTTFLLKLPLTLAIIDGLLVRVGQQRFVVPTFCVRESLRPRADHVHSVQGTPRMVQVRDSLVPIVRLSELFDVPDAETDPCKATVVVIEDDGRRVGLVVDQLLGKQEAVIKSLGEVFSSVRGIAGGAILGDGRVGLIVDATGILALSGVGAQAA